MIKEDVLDKELRAMKTAMSLYGVIDEQLDYLDKRIEILKTVVKSAPVKGDIVTHCEIVDMDFNGFQSCMDLGYFYTFTDGKHKKCQPVKMQWSDNRNQAIVWYNLKVINENTFDRVIFNDDTKTNVQTNKP